MRKSSGIKKALSTMLAVGSAVVLFAGTMPGVAWAYFSMPAPSISVAGGVSVASGSSTAIVCTISPESELQLPGCGMAECPQACDGLVKPGDSKPGGCLDANGWCTCAGTGYYTAYTSVQVSSSNPSVARASYASGVLSIVGYQPGTADISISASLSKHVPSAASVSVTVYDNAPTPSTPSNNSGSSSDSGSSSVSGSGSGGTGGAVSVTAVGGTSATAAAAAAAAASGSEESVVEMEAEDGSKTIVVEAKDASTAAEELGKIAGTKGTVTFWSGGTLGSPAISWTFKGENIAEGADLNIDPTVSVSKRGTGDVAKLLADVDKTIVMDFAHSGNLPAPAEVFVRASDVFADGDELSLFVYNEETKKFERVQDAVAVADGYATFTIEHCSTWALSKEDLTKLELPAGETAADAGETDATQVNVHAASGTPYVIAIAVVAVVAVAVAAAIVVRRKKAAVAADAPEEAAQVESEAIGAKPVADAAEEGEK